MLRAQNKHIVDQNYNQDARTNELHNIDFELLLIQVNEVVNDDAECKH